MIAALPAAMAGSVSVATPASAEPYGTHWAGAWSAAAQPYFAKPTGPATFHQFATATAYTADGDHRFDVRDKAFADAGQSRYFLSGIDVTGASQAAVVTFGDSITDGVGSTPDTDNRYPDELAERLVAAHRPLTVLNAGIGGNKVLNDSGCFGESQPARFQRDVLDQPGVRTVILQGGLNDLGAPLLNHDCVRPNPRVTAEQLIEGFKTLINAAHTRRITAIGTTITPMRGSIFDSDEGERVRDAVNEWIHTSGAYDAVVDFDRSSPTETTYAPATTRATTCTPTTPAIRPWPRPSTCPPSDPTTLQERS
ncbi:GDSL-type esterase/lipase family protein [Streptosporangium subroseum]|uniref:GDSL-type esterase/lipase family protein n=1 Tax=Streptosporangium subroseum TaxID=106412 RepID=UPI0034488773